MLKLIAGMPVDYEPTDMWKAAKIPPVPIKVHFTEQSIPRDVGYFRNCPLEPRWME